MNRKPFVMVHRSIVDDARFASIYDDKATLGWWLTLRLRADAEWPYTAEIPAGRPEQRLATLVDAGLVVTYPRGRYRMPDYDDEREARAAAGRVGGQARAASAGRDASGRYQPAQPAAAGSDRSQPLRAEQLSASQSSEAGSAPARVNGPAGYDDEQYKRLVERKMRHRLGLPAATD